MTWPPLSLQTGGQEWGTLYCLPTAIPAPAIWDKGLTYQMEEQRACGMPQWAGVENNLGGNDCL